MIFQCGRPTNYLLHLQKQDVKQHYISNFELIPPDRFLEAVASLGLAVSLSQSVTQSVCDVLVKLDKLSIGGSRISPA